MLNVECIQHCLRWAQRNSLGGRLAKCGNLWKSHLMWSGSKLHIEHSSVRYKRFIIIIIIIIIIGNILWRDLIIRARLSIVSANIYG